MQRDRPTSRMERRRAGRARRRRLLRQCAIATAAVVVVAAVSVGGTLAASTKTVTISVDGSARQVDTVAGTVDGVLAAADIRVGPHDSMAPTGGTTIADGSRIVIRRGRTVSLTLNGHPRQFWTTARTVDAALAADGRDPSRLRLSVQGSAPIPPAGLRLSAASLHQVIWADAGSPAIPVTTTAATVRALLADRGVALRPDDTVTPPLDTPLADTTQVTVDRVRHTTETATVEVPQQQVTKTSDRLTKGTTHTIPGRRGVERVAYRTTIVNGRPASRTIVRRTTVVQPAPTVTVVGTRTPPEHVGNKVFFHDWTYGVDWDGLASCESSNNPRALGPGDAYFGLFQFDLPTWHSVGGTGDPRDASPAEQLRLAKKLYRRRGLQPWQCAWAGRQ